jgi:hypothetical protein
LTPCWLQAVPLLASVTALIFAFLFIAGLIGMQLFSESYHLACIDDVTGIREKVGTPQPYQWGCGGYRDCPSGYTCKEIAGMAGLTDNVAGFDHVGSAMLTAFQVRRQSFQRLNQLNGFVKLHHSFHVFVCNTSWWNQSVL